MEIEKLPRKKLGNDWDTGEAVYDRAIDKLNEVIEQINRLSDELKARNDAE